MFLKFGSHYYLYSHCFRKGIHEEINMKKSLDILQSGFSDSFVSENKYLYYRIGRIYNSIEMNKEA